jgi:serine/threonine protein kinase
MGLPTVRRDDRLEYEFLMNSEQVAKWGPFEGLSIEDTYRLKGLIGAGGFAGVFYADHVVEDRTLRHVAVKLIFADAKTIERQLDELVAATMLQHSNILRCFHAGSAMLGRSKLLYLVMEIAEGSLESRLEHGVLPLLEVTVLTEQTASALVYLHQLNLVHRDLKAGNILRVGGVWKLADFGTVRQPTSDTRNLTGTIWYMPPESFDGVVSPAWDSWPLGVLVLKSLTGKWPFAAATENELVAAIMYLGESRVDRGLSSPPS